jgi:hypothetical protein
MQPSTVALIGAVVAVAGTLAGVFLGQKMNKDAQRDQWVRDNRKEESRELMIALAESLRVELMMYPGAVLSSDQQRLIIETHSNAMQVIRSRIFIVDVIIRADIETKWGLAIKAHQDSFHPAPLGQAFNEIRLEVVNATGDTYRQRDWRSTWRTRRRIREQIAKREAVQSIKKG